MGGVDNSWHIELLTELRSAEIPCDLVFIEGFWLVMMKNGTLVLNLMDLTSPKLPEALLTLQDSYRSTGAQLIQLWEDLWYTRKAQVLSRIKAIVGLNTRIYARKTDIRLLSQAEADAFLNENHLQLAVRLKYRYGLVLHNELVAVAGFSGLRKMNNGIINYRSAELIRFANLLGTTVTGGFTKLLSHFIKQHQPNDVMSYADRDWSLGLSYEKSGFTLVETTPPTTILLNKDTLTRTFPHRLDETSLDDQYLKVFNTGNLKYILTCE